jgi:hypothetical protein
VDLKALMDGLSSLLLPSQKPLFSQHMYALKGLIFLTLFDKLYLKLWLKLEISSFSWPQKR